MTIRNSERPAEAIRPVIRSRLRRSAGTSPPGGGTASGRRDRVGGSSEPGRVAPAWKGAVGGPWACGFGTASGLIMVCAPPDAATRPEQKRGDRTWIPPPDTVPHPTRQRRRGNEKVSLAPFIPVGREIRFRNAK